MLHKKTWTALKTSENNCYKKKFVKRNLDTFDLEQVVGTNAEALDRLVDILYGERQHRLKRKSMENEGRPFLQTLRVPSDKTEANWAFLKNLFI